jgi:hypothetical protein
VAVSLADLQRWRDALFEARLSGVREVRDQNGEAITYRSDSEMASALAAADRAIAAASGRTSSTIKFQTSKGL